jgi:uncharacterized protein YndB with AHSA1/START domain
MTKNKQTLVSKDAASKKITVVREFDAPLIQVWQAWTESDLLDQWWAPRPWKAVTKTMDFSEGGFWLYAMTGPDDTKHWCRVNFNKIVANKSFTVTNFFCDADGNKNEDFPVMNWKNDFRQTDTGTKVEVEIIFDNEADFEKILQMGFEEGFKMGLSNLDELLAK